MRPIATPVTTNPTAHSSSGLVQPMFNTASATSDAKGNITFTFGGVFTGQILIGSFSCPSAPYTAQFTAYNNQQEIYSWQSSNNPGPVRVAENQQITVSGTGLVPSTNYVMNWVGYSTVSGFAPQVVPESHSDVVIATNQGGLQTTRNNNAITDSAILPAPPSGFAYRLHSLSYLPGSPTAATAAGLMEIFYTDSAGVQGIIFASIWLSGQIVGGTILLDGLLVDGAPSAAFSSSPGFSVIIVSLNYDVIQI